MVHHEFQTPRNRCKYEIVRRVLSSVSTCLELAFMKHEAKVFDMSFQMKQQEIMQRHVFSGIALVVFYLVFR